MRFPRPLRVLLAGLPSGAGLPADIWAARHRGLIRLLALHLVGLPAFGLVEGFGPFTVALMMAPIIALTASSAAPDLGRTARSLSLVLGLLSCSAILVIFWHGTIEAHFHFFVVLGAIALYEAWLPYVIAFLFVILEHGLMSAVMSSAVFNHADAIHHPWKWSAIHGLFVGALGIVNLISWKASESVRAQRAIAEAALAHRAGHDPLTDLPNRALFTERLHAALAREDRQVAVVFCDLDDFKVINDSLGHGAGDELLVEVADRLSASIRPQDLLARFGGDEFVMMLDGIADPEAARHVSDRLSFALASPFVVEGVARFVSASFGIAVSDATTTDDAELLRDADAAMYRAKELGKARSAVFDLDMRSRAITRLEIETGLRTALAEGQLEVHYQPQLAFSGEEVVGVEALVRWRHPEHGLVSPGVFIPVAEKSGLIDEIGAWVLREACEQLARWNALRSEPLVMSVNLSARQLGDPTLPDVVSRVLAETDVAPATLCLELTESALMADRHAGLALVDALKALGVRLAVDDFGVGQSSLAQLTEIATADVLKIDKSFVDRVALAPEHRAIAAAIVQLAGALDFSVVAEGVETAEQVAVLRELGCHVAQGFYYARPEPADALAERLLGRRSPSAA